MDLSRPHEVYLENELWILAIGGAFQRASVYRDGVSETKRRKFREAIKARVRGFVKDRYCGQAVSSEDHIRTVEEISTWVSKEHSAVLSGGRLRIGVAQKLLNLYLKYLWCWGKIREPPHYPFDKTIIDMLQCPRRVSWTELDDIGDYRMLVEAARKAAGDGLSLAQWELQAFNRQ